MPPYYEEAARLLCTMTRFGFVLSPQSNPHSAILKLAAHIYVTRIWLASHYDAAIDVLKDMEDGSFGTYDHKARGKLLALIGTALANHQATFDARRRQMFTEQSKDEK